MKIQAVTTLVGFLVVVGGAEAFSVASSRTTAVGPLHVGLAVDWNDQGLDEDYLMQRAEACATSDECSLEEAQIALTDVLHVQSGCASGTISGSACQNVNAAAELVANLRVKVAQKAREAL